MRRRGGLGTVKIVLGGEAGRAGAPRVMSLNRRRGGTVDDSHTEGGRGHRGIQGEGSIEIHGHTQGRVRNRSRGHDSVTQGANPGVDEGGHAELLLYNSRDGRSGRLLTS